MFYQQLKIASNETPWMIDDKQVLR